MLRASPTRAQVSLMAFGTWAYVGVEGGGRACAVAVALLEDVSVC